MPKYKVNGRTFNIPDNEVDLFEADFPEAQLHYQTNDGRKFTIYANERKDFLSDFPDATELGWGETIKEQAKQADPFQPEDSNLAQPMFGSMSYQDNIGKPEDYPYYPSPLNEEGRAETQPLSPEERSKQEYEMLMGHLKDFDNNNGDFMDTYEAYEKAAKHQINEGGFAIDTFERRYLDENSNEYHQRKMEKDELNERIKSNSYFNQMRMAEADAANETVDAISNLMAQNEAENSELHKKMQAMNALSMNPRGSFSGFAKTKEMQEYMDERADLETAKRLYENTAQVYAAPINDGEDILKKFGQGFGQRVDDADFWTMGIIGIADDMNARAAFQKIQDKLGSVKELANLTDAEIDALLTPSEQLLISAVMDNNAAQYARMDNTSGAYQAGAGAADSLMFMAQFLLTGGIGEAATVGTAAHRRLVSWLGRKVGSMSNGLMKDVARGAVKLGVGTAESIGKALVMTPLMPHTYANIADKMMSFDDNGELMDTTDAIISGSIDALIETWSESTGDFVNKILGVPGNITKGVAKKVLKNVDFSDWGKAMNAPMMKILKKGGFNGFLGEMGEEFIGNATRSLVGTLAPGSGQDPEALKNFAQWEQLLITAGSFAPMTIFGLGVSSAQYGWQKRQLNNAQKAFESMLREASYTEDQARFIVDELLGSTDANLTPEKLVANFSPLLKELAFNDRFANNRTQAMQSAVDFMLQIARYRTFDGVYHRQEEQQRNDMLAEIQEGTGREFWTTRLSENAGLDGTAYETDEVRAVEFNDGRVAYILGSDGTTNTVVYNDGQTGFLSEEQLNEGKTNGSIVSDATMGLNDYLTQQVARVRMTEEEQRMFDERNTNIGQVRAQFPIDATVELGTTEAPIQGVVRQQTPDGVIVESPAGISQLTWEELGHTMGIEVNPQTDAQMEEEAINNLEIADLQRRRAREQRRTQRNTAAEAALEEEQMLDEAENEGLEKPIPMKADGTVDQTAFWNESPARWAQWKTEQRQDGGAYASSYIQNAIGILEGQIAESEAAFLAESDFDAKDALEQTINQQRARLAELQDLSMQYMPSVIPAETSVEATAEQTQPSEETAQTATPMPQNIESEPQTEEERRKPLRQKAQELSEKLGVKVNIAESISDVKEAKAREEILRIDISGSQERATGWFNPETGEVTIYLPHTTNTREIEKTIIHEVVAHKGLRGLLGEEGFNVLCDSVWDMMTEEERAKFLAYPGVNGNTRAAADEYIAHYAENVNLEESKPIWDRIMDLITRILNSMGVTLEITKEDLSDIIVASYQKLVADAKTEQGTKPSGTEGVVSDNREGVGTSEGSSFRVTNPEEVNPAFVEAISTDVDEAEYAQFLDDKAFADPQPVDGIQPDDVRFSIVLEDKMRGNTQAYFDKHYNGGTLGKKDQKLVPLNVTHFTQVLLDAANAQIEEMRKYMLPYLDMESKGKRFLPAEVYGKSTLFDNSSYGKTMENTLICTRTLAYIDFVEEVKKRIGRPLTATESFLASQMLYDIAVDPQCLYCYVSLDRKAYDEFLLRYIQQRDEVISKWNASDKSAEAKDALYKEFLAGRKPTSQMQARFESWLLLSEGDNAITPADLATKARRGDLKISEAPEAWEKARNKYQKLKGDKKLAYAASEEYQTALWNYLASPLGQVTDAEAYAQSASWAKKEEDYRSYTGELLKCTADALKGLMGHYGLRFYSFSEYSPAFILENMQMVRDAAARGLKGFAYTKEIDFIKIFAPTGMNINCSVYGRVDSEGNVVPDIKQGADWARVQALREQYPNVGAVFVATNDEMVEWALNQPWIDVIIPFHIVRTGADIAKFYEWTNYSSMQADTAPSGKTTYIFPHEHHNDKTTFLKIAQERGLSPRFADVKLADGRSIVEHPNYMRLVNETRRSVDETPILTPTFNVDAAKESFDAFVAKGGYYSGYFYEDEAFEQGIETVVEDIKAGKTAKDVDYGRQDVPIDVAKIMAKRAEMERKHGKSGVIDLVEEARKSVDNTSDIRFSIIGEMGATRDRSDEGLARLNNLEVARQMESQLNPDWSAKNDENALKIKVATGWERGADGKWRHEVDDVTIKPAKDWLLSKKKLTLRDIVEPNPVFDIYPELLDIAVVKDKSKYSLGAWYAESTKQMKLPVGALKDDYTAMMDYYGEEQKDGNFARYWKIMEEDFLHEIQHAIQHREGFARGGNPDMLLPEDMEAYNKLYDEMSDLIDTYNSIPTRDRNMAYAISARNQAQRAKDGVTSFLRKHKLGEERYKRLAGEVESNNVVKRSKLSDYERYNSLLASTEDVARKDQIFLMNAVESAESSLRFRITPEMKEIKKKAEEDGTFMMAPNGQPTNLTEEQWLMVRTKNFIKWFGDWLKPQRIEKLRNSEDASINGDEIAPAESLDKKAALEYGKKLQGFYTNKDTGASIQLQRGRKNGGVNEVLQHNYKDAEHLQSIAAIPQIIEKSIFIESAPNADLEKNPDVVEYQHFVCGLKIGGEDYTVHSLVAVDKKGDRYYDHNLTAIEKKKLLDLIESQAVEGEDFGTTPGTQPTILSTYKGKQLVSLLQVDASKVVDENGEPKVVYHQTNQKIYVNRETGENWDELGWKEKMEWDERDDWEDYWEEQDFNTFSRVNARTTNEFDGFFFAPKYDEYHEYGDRTIAAFVNIKNPASREDYNIDSRYNDAGRNERIRLQEAGFDGVIRMDGDNVDEYIAFEPNQIKSATDNNGDFNPNNNDIRFRVTAEQDKAYMDAVEAGDLETAQKMVDAAARAAGYDSPKLYHGTRNFGFTKADVTKSDDGISFFATTSPSIAKTYSSVGGERRISDKASTEDRKAIANELGEAADEYLLEHTSNLAEWLNVKDVDAFALELTDMVYGTVQLAEEQNKDEVTLMSDLMKGYDAIIDKYYDADKYASSEEQINNDDGTWDNRMEVIAAYGKYIQAYNNPRIYGNYTFYATTWAMEEIDCKGANWNNIKSSDLPQSSRPWTTRRVARFMKEEGWKGVILKNIVDLGGRANIPEVEWKSNIYIFFEPQWQVKSADPVTYDDEGNVIPLSQRFNPENGDIRFRMSNENQAIFVSNAAKAVEGIKQEKATPEQWLKMIEKAGGLKAGEDKWMGLSDWLKESDKKTLTKQEVLDFINENMIQIEEVHYDINAEDDAERAHSEITEKLQDRFDHYEDEYYQEHDWDGETEDARAYAIEKLREEMGDTFPYTIELEYGNVYLTFPYEEEDDLVVWAQKTGVEYTPGVAPINETRLNYTTDGLENKHEIALTVPTIESWNVGDEIHFGDAGDGRAVAWIRFGETEVYDVVDRSQEIEKAKAEYLDYTDNLKEKYNIVGYGMGTLDEKASSEEKETYDAMFRRIKDLQKEHGSKISVNKKVLVIDEIQSKRHQEGREKGYATMSAAEFSAQMNDKYGTQYFGWQDKASPEEWEKYRSLSNAIPDAPFEKNWHELAMKRMLRYAAENGYDAIAWTKGDQQAERYNIGDVVTSVDYRLNNDGSYRVDTMGRDGYQMEGIPTTFNSEAELAEIFGKDIARKIAGNLENDKQAIAEADKEIDELREWFSKNTKTDEADLDSLFESAINNPEQSKRWNELEVKKEEARKGHTLSETDFRIGGEGMKGFYDKILPAFMNKYGKKWGVKVEDIELPNLEEAGRVMHSMPVTDSMKASVMEGQVMFRMRGENESAKEFTDSIVKDFKDDYNAVAPIEIVDLNSKEDVARFFNIPAEDITDDDIQFIKNDVEKKDIWAAYHPDLKKIVIFVRDSLTDSKKGELALIHENIHAINGKYPEFLALGEYLWNRVEEGTKEHKYKTAIQKFYPEHKWHDELSAYVVSEHMQNGTLDELRYVLDLEHTNILNKILNTSGYGKERKSDRAGFFRNVLRKRSSGKVGRASEKKGGASELTAEERRIIGEYFPEFNKTEDVRMRVNSQGKELTEGQEEFFANSKAVDKDGNLLVLYHGTPRAGFTEFKSGWFTTSKEDAISYSGDRKGRLFDPNEKYEPETLTAGDFRLGYMTFDSEEDRAAFLGRFSYADEVMSEREYEDARMGAEDEEYDALTARRKEFAEVWNAYREYERERFVDTTIADLIANPEAYTEEDLMRAMLEYDSNATFDNLDDMSAEERMDALVSALQNANEETEGGILDMVVPTRVPRNGEGLKHNDLGNRTYEVYANVENPYEIDANGRGSEFESGDIYKSVEEALADEQYDGVIIRNWRVGRTQQLGDVIVPKDGSQIKLTSNENPSESSDIQFRITEGGEESDIRFSIRTKPAPEHVETAYKLFNVDENGNPHALFIDGANALERGVWYDADSPLVKDLEKLEPGFTYLVDKDGNAIQKQYKNKQKSPSKAEVEEATANGSRYILVGQYANGKKSYHNWGINGSGQVSKFAMRPGWHLTDSPSARHIGEERNPEKKEEAMYRRPNQRWFKVEYAADVDYNEEAASNPTKDIQTHIPEDGYYSFKTNTNANDVNQNWIISGSIRILDPLSREEVTRLNSENSVPDDLDYREEPSFRTTGTPTDEVVANGLQLTPAQTAEVAANIFAALPEESRKKITEGLNGNILGLKDAILQIPTSLATKENWNEVDRAMADVVAEEMTKMAGEMTRPFSAEEGLWLLYNNLNKGTDLISQASRALVQRNLGFDAETLAKQEQAKEDVRFRTVGDASSNAEASLYNRGAANVWTRLKESYVDMMASVEELVKAIEKRTGKVAQGFENILLALNQQSSKGLAAMESYEQRFLKPMFDEIRRIMDETKMKYEDVVRYVILKHGLERNKKLAQRDARAHYQEIYDDIISKINSMDDRQKRTYLTNAQLKEADAKANLSTLQAVDTSLMTDEEKKEHKKQLAIARKAVAEAEEYLKRAEKIRSMSEQEAKDELDKIFEKIENGTDSVFKEMRKNDYSGISSMFYDQLGVNRKDYSTEEEYQAALMLAKNDRFSSLEEVEAQAEGEVSSFEGRVDTKELWKRINAATKETLRQQYEANMISKDQYLNLRDMFEYYVPLRGFKDNTAEDMYTYYRKPNSTGYTKPILGAEGRKTEAESPFGWIAAMAGSAIASNVKNEAKLALYYFVSNRPENGIATISKTWFVDSGEVDERGKKIFKPAYPPFSEDLSSAEGKAQYEIWQANMKELQKKGQAYEAGQRLNLGNAVVNISDANKPEHIVNVKVGGKDYTIIINGNPRAAQAINGDLNIETNDTYNNVLLGPWLRWLSSVNTSYNPEFWATNMMRDVAFTIMAVNIKGDPNYRRKFFKNYRKALKVVSMVVKNEKGTLGNSYIEQQYKDFVKYGGVTGFTQIKDSETWEKEIEKYLKNQDADTTKAIKAVKDGLHAFHRFGESLEQVSRFAAFLTAVETGKSINEAINDAKEITVNFNRKGSGKRITIEEAKLLTKNNGQRLNDVEAAIVSGISYLAPIARSTIMFFNASVQALNAWFKLWKANKLRSLSWVIGYATVGVINALIHALVDDDDEYLDIPQYERRSSLMLGGNGVYFKWALPQEMSAFYALGELSVETIFGRNPHQSAAAEAVKVVGDMLPVNIAKIIMDKGGWVEAVPSQVKPFLELIRNEDYKGDVIFNEQKWLSEGERERTANWESAYKGTGRTYIEISKLLNNLTDSKDLDEAGWINIHPESLEHVVESMAGGVGRTVSKLFNFITAAINPEEDVTVKQTPFLNRFLTINDERFKNVHVNDVFDYYKADAEHALTLEKQYTKDRDKESLTELRRSDEYQWAKIYGKYKKPLKSIQDKIKVADGTAEKKELMKQQDELKKRMIKEISEL